MKKNSSSQKTKTVEIFREDDLYVFTLPQHAALALVLQHALDRISDPKDRDVNSEDITSSTPFEKRYWPQGKSVLIFLPFMGL